MNRRSFISAILAAAASPSILVAGAHDRFRWKQTAAGLWIRNPAWEKAEYRIEFLIEKHGVLQWVAPRDAPFFVASEWTSELEHRRNQIIDKANCK